MVHPLTPEISDLKQIADDQWQSIVAAFIQQVKQDQIDGCVENVEALIAKYL